MEGPLLRARAGTADPPPWPRAAGADHAVGSRSSRCAPDHARELAPVLADRGPARLHRRRAGGRGAAARALHPAGRRRVARRRPGLAELGCPRSAGTHAPVGTIQATISDGYDGRRAEARVGHRHEPPGRGPCDRGRPRRHASGCAIQGVTGFVAHIHPDHRRLGRGRAASRPRPATEAAPCRRGALGRVVAAFVVRSGVDGGALRKQHHRGEGRWPVVGARAVVLGRVRLPTRLRACFVTPLRVPGWARSTATIYVDLAHPLRDADGTCCETHANCGEPPRTRGPDTSAGTPSPSMMQLSAASGASARRTRSNP